MKEKVDTGGIILTSYFNCAPQETVESLKVKALCHLLYLFEKVMWGIHSSDSLPVSNEKWLREPYTWKQFNDLRRIDFAAMDEEEILLRIRASDYSKQHEGAYYEIGGKRLVYVSETDVALL